jgi:hypothetical protein
MSQSPEPERNRKRSQLLVIREQKRDIFGKIKEHQGVGRRRTVKYAARQTPQTDAEIVEKSRF